MILRALTSEWERQLAWQPSPWPSLPGTLDDALARLREDPDAGFLVLLTSLAAGDTLAGRVVVQAMVPRLLRDAADGLDEGSLVSQLWLVAAEYPTDRRRENVAASLALDARKRAVADARREREVPGLAVAPRGDEPDAEWVLQRAERLRLVSPDTRRILAEVYQDGESRRVVARRHGITEVALRQRCSKAVRRMSGHRHALAAA